MVGAVVLGGNVLVQVPHVAATVTAVVAAIRLLAAGSPGLLCGGLQVEGEQGWQGGSSHTGGGAGGFN